MMCLSILFSADSHANVDRQAIRSFNRMFVVVPKGPG